MLTPLPAPGNRIADGNRQSAGPRLGLSSSIVRPRGQRRHCPRGWSCPQIPRRRGCSTGEAAVHRRHGLHASDAAVRLSAADLLRGPAWRALSASDPADALRGRRNCPRAELSERAGEGSANNATLSETDASTARPRVASVTDPCHRWVRRRGGGLNWPAVGGSRCSACTGSSASTRPHPLHRHVETDGSVHHPPHPSHRLRSWPSPLRPRPSRRRRGGRVGVPRPHGSRRRGPTSNPSVGESVLRRSDGAANPRLLTA